MKTLIITDNLRALGIAQELRKIHGRIDIYQSPDGTIDGLEKLDVNNDCDFIATNYSLVVSLHCKQLFSKKFISKVRCVNVHPGYNPYNRGWFPHVFSIINGSKAGVTIHEIDEKLDHGPIIAQKEYEIKTWETSDSAYDNLMQLERKLVLEWFERIRDNSYKTFNSDTEGNINSKKDYESLKSLDLNRIGSFSDFFNLLRALTHGSYRNAYFLDNNGRRVFVRVILEREDA